MILAVSKLFPFWQGFSASNACIFCLSEDLSHGCKDCAQFIPPKTSPVLGVLTLYLCLFAKQFKQFESAR